jgi:hypothetical protein
LAITVPVTVAEVWVIATAGPVVARGAAGGGGAGNGGGGGAAVVNVWSAP